VYRYAHFFFFWLTSSYVEDSNKMTASCMFCVLQGGSWVRMVVQALRTTSRRKSTIFGGGTKIFPPFPPQISYDTFCKETYQRGPSQLTAMSPHSLFPNRASRRWEYSHLARSLPCFADQNLLGSHNTLTGGCSILIRKSL
jgi:hypothetical protein